MVEESFSGRNTTKLRCEGAVGVWESKGSITSKANGICKVPEEGEHDEFEDQK